MLLNQQLDHLARIAGLLEDGKGGRLVDKGNRLAAAHIRVVKEPTNIARPPLLWKGDVKDVLAHQRPILRLQVHVAQIERLEDAHLVAVSGQDGILEYVLHGFELLHVQVANDVDEGAAGDVRVVAGLMLVVGLTFRLVQQANGRLGKWISLSGLVHIAQA